MLPFQKIYDKNAYRILGKMQVSVDACQFTERTQLDM